MVCPSRVCKSTRITVLFTRTEHMGARKRNGPDSFVHHNDKDQRDWPKRLEGANVIRRRRQCSACGYKWFTVEIVEDDFEMLRAKTGRLEQSTGTLPGMGGRGA